MSHLFVELQIKANNNSWTDRSRGDSERNQEILLRHKDFHHYEQASVQISNPRRRQARITTKPYQNQVLCLRMDEGCIKKDPSAEMEGQVLLKHTLGQCEAFEGILQTAAVRQDMKQCVKTRAI